MAHEGWIGIDFDGTLAVYNGYISADHCGEPIRPMVELVREFLAQGEEVRIFTARIYPINMCVRPEVDNLPELGLFEALNDAVTALKAIRAYCLTHFGVMLAVTNVKDPGMKVLYDERCRQVESHTGFVK